MSLIEDIRKVIQDLVAPGDALFRRDLTLRIKWISHATRSLFSKIQLVDQKVEYLVQDAISRINSTEQRLQAKFDSLISTLEIDKRLSRLEKGLVAKGLVAEGGGGGSISESGAHRKAQPVDPKARRGSEPSRPRGCRPKLPLPSLMRSPKLMQQQQQLKNLRTVEN